MKTDVRIDFDASFQLMNHLGTVHKVREAGFHRSSKMETGFYLKPHSVLHLIRQQQGSNGLVWVMGVVHACNGVTMVSS